MTIFAINVLFYTNFTHIYISRNIDSHHQPSYPGRINWNSIVCLASMAGLGAVHHIINNDLESHDFISNTENNVLNASIWFSYLFCLLTTGPFDFFGIIHEKRLSIKNILFNQAPAYLSFCVVNIIATGLAVTREARYEEDSLVPLLTTDIICFLIFSIAFAELWIRRKNSQLSVDNQVEANEQH